MTVTGTVFASGALVIVGRWLKNEPITARIVIGMVALAYLLMAASAANKQFGRGLGLLVLFAATWDNLPTIVGKLFGKTPHGTTR